MLDENSNVEKTITDSDSEEQFRASLRREKNRKKKRQRSGEDGGGDDSVPGNILVELLCRISRWNCFAEFHLFVKNWVSVCDNS